MIGQTLIRRKFVILLAFFLLILHSGLGLAADCSTDPNSCTPKQLCEISTKNAGDVKVWADSIDLRSHVEVAKELGINCGNVKDECDVSPEKCKLNQICERATTVENGKLNWNFDNLGHVVLAKEYGLKCLDDDVGAVKKKPEKQNFNQSSSEAIDVVKLIQIEMNRIGCSLGFGSSFFLGLGVSFGRCLFPGHSTQKAPRFLCLTFFRYLGSSCMLANALI